MFLIDRQVARAFLVTIALVGIVFFPPWVPLIAMVLLSFRFRAWEVPVMGILMDFVWLTQTGHPVPLYTIGAIIIVWGLEPIRNELLV